MTSPPWLQPDIPTSLAFYDKVLRASATSDSIMETRRMLCRGDLFYLMAYALNRPDVIHPWIFDRCREVQREPDGYLDLWSRDSYKDLANGTPMLTANRGWTTHGGLVVGDYVFSPNGVPVEVLAVSEQYIDSKCYEISFVKSQAKIVAGSGHLWRLRRKISNRIPHTDQRIKRFVDEIYSTEDLLAKKGRLDIGCASPLQYPEKNLSIHPYVLGCWLGDGTSSCATITCAYSDSELIDRIRGFGVRATERKSSNENSGYYQIDFGERGTCRKGLQHELRKMGVLNNKHIPQEYMTSSIDQRMQLLRGLMDTDGHCALNGSATFCQKKERLSRDIYELAAGLGLKPNIRKVNGKYKGEPYLYFHVSFPAHADRNPFSLKRKAERALPPSHYRGVRIIDSIKQIPSVPTKCIQVVGDMYLAGRELLPTHNSSLLSFGLTIKDILNDPEDTICIFSHTKTNAKKFLRQIKREFEINKPLIELFPDVLYTEPDRESPLWSEDTGLVVRRTGNPKEPTLKASGLVDGQQTGDHFKKRIYDDVVTQESVTTPEQIAKTTEGWEMSLSLGTKDSKERYAGTRYSIHDTYHEILKRKAVIPRLYPATHNGKMDGHPVYFTEHIWAEKLRKLSRFNIASQYLQNPLADEDAVFSALWLKTWEVRPRMVNIAILGDPNRKVGAGNDNCSFSVVALSATGNKYFVDGYCHQMTQSQRWTALRDLWVKWSKAPGVQNIQVGYEKYGAEQDLNYFQERMQEEKGVDGKRLVFSIEELSWTREGTKGQQGKRARIERLEPDFRNGRFYLPQAVYHDGQPCTWLVDDDPGSKTYQTVDYRPVLGMAKAQMRAVEVGDADLVCKAIRRVNQEGKMYDVTEHLIGEFLYFPFGEYKDSLDSLSRLYDLDMVPPVAWKKGAGEPPQFFDS